jgi:hypothetical protein
VPAGRDEEPFAIVIEDDNRGGPPRATPRAAGVVARRDMLPVPPRKYYHHGVPPGAYALEPPGLLRAYGHRFTKENTTKPGFTASHAASSG